MKTPIIVTFCLVILAASCSDKSAVIRHFENIDSLNSKGQFDSAYNEVMKFNTKHLNTDEERAYYYLLKTEVLFMNDISIDNDSMIDFSINYYEKHGDYGKLATAYYYKGAVTDEKGDRIKGIYFIKKAESCEKKADNPMLRFMIYINMAYLNSVENANKTGLEYAKKALAEADAMNSVNLKCLAFNNIAMCYYNLNYRDSAMLYMERNKQYVHKIQPEENRAVVLTNIGVIYYDNKMYKEADSLFRQAITILPISTTRINLAKTSSALGDNSKADSLLRLAWPDADNEEKAEILQFLAERAEKRGDDKSAASLYKRAKAMQDSVNADRKAEEAVATQRDYEHEEYKEDVKKGEAWGAAAAAAVALLAVWGVVYHRRKINKARKMIAEGGKMIAEYTARIGELERADRQHSHEAQELRRKIKKLKDEQNEILGRGQRLYEGIAAGGTTATWKKQDFEEFIEFYRVSHPEAVADAEDNYRRLSATNIFYLILRDMQVDDGDAQRILCITAGAFRTMKSRVNARRTKS